MNKRGYYMLAGFLLGIIVLGLFFSRQSSGVKLVSAQETFDRTSRDSNVVLLDVRTQEEYNAGHISSSILIPLQELQQRARELDPFKGKEIIAYCRSGNRSGKAAELLGKEGFTVLNMEGGILKWKELHLPVVEGQAK